MAIKTEEAQIEVIINGQKAAANVAEMEKAVKLLNAQWKQLTPGTDAAIKKGEEIKKLTGRINEAKASLKDTTEEAKSFVEELETIGPIGGILNTIKTGFSEVTNGIGVGVKALGTFTGALMATGILAFVAIIGSLYTYFKKTEEGADFLEKATAGLGAAVNVVTGLVIKFAEYIIAAFENPKQTVKDLVDFIVTNLINRVKAWAVIFEGLFELDFEKISNGFIQAATGIEDATGKARQLGKEIGKIAEETEKAVKAAMDLTKRTQDLEDAERDLKVLNSEKKGQITELMKMAEQQTLTEKQRIQALREAGKIEKDLTHESLKIAQERYNITKAQNDLLRDQGTKVSDEDKDKEAEALIRLNELRAESANKQQEIRNKESAFIKKLSEDRKRMMEEEAKKQEEVRKNIQKLELDALDDSLASNIKKLQVQASEEIKNLKGTEEQKAKQRELIEKKLQADIARIEEASRKEQEKKAEEAAKKEFDIRRRNAFAVSDMELMLAEGNHDKMLQATISRLELERQYALENANLTAQEVAAINANYNNKRVEAEKQHQEQKLESDKAIADQAGQLGQFALQTVQDFSNIANEKDIRAAEQSRDKKIAMLDKELASKKITQEQYDKARQDAEENADRKTRAIKKKQAEGDKRASIAQAFIATSLAVAKALPNIVLAAIAGVMGAVQVAKIAATPLPEFRLGGILKRSFRRLWSGAKAMFSGGAVIRKGSPHGDHYGQSGIALVDRNSGAELGEMEVDEVIMAKGVSRNPALLREASRINELAGGRRLFAGGGIPASTTPVVTGAPSGTNLTNNSNSGNLEATLNRLATVLENMPDVIKAYVLYSDLQDAAATDEQIRAEASIE